MSRLDELIKELCPDGVEYMPLERVAKISNGRDHKHLEDGKIPVYGSGGIMRYANQYIYDNISVLIPRKGSIGNIFYIDTPFWTVDTIFYTKINFELINAKFLYHFLLTQNIEKLNTAGGVPSLTKTILDKVQIPIPPLPVQEEIVRILDTFTELTTELTTELIKRKKQYEYYREQLFNLNEEMVDYVCLGDEIVGKFTRGGGLQKKDFTDTGIGCIHYGQIYTYYGIYTNKTKTFVSEEFAQKARKAKYGDLIIATTSENDEEVCKAVAWLGCEEIAVSSDACFYTHNMHPKYVAYFFQTEQFQKQKRPFITGTKVRRVNVDNLEKIKIPIPPFPEQQRIVDILDRFDTLCNDISSGLPAEIKARQQQYEYYRDKLLTFQRLN